MSVSASQVSKLFAKVLGHGPSGRTLAAQQQDLDRLVERLRPRGFWLGAKLAVAAAACVLAAVALWKLTSQTRGLYAEYNGSMVAEQEQVETTAGQGQPLEFSDGSRVMLEENTQAVLSYLTDRRADLILRNGVLNASIEKRTGATWTIAAGPYRVRVVGTKFRVDWNGGSGELGVRVREGRVWVYGGDLPKAGISLAAGGQLSRKYQAQARVTKQLDEPAGTAVGESAQGRESPDSERRVVPQQRTSKEPTNWEQLSDKGKYGEALRVAKDVGFAGLMEQLPANPLLKLGNTARFAGDPSSAKRALTRLRQRFPRSSAARLSAVYMARLAEDEDHNPAEAARWLRVYLRESPTGGLASDARANLLSILLNLGDTDGARAVARDYLKYDPRGPHAEKARSLVAQSHDSTR